MEQLTKQQINTNNFLLAGLKNLKQGLNHFSLEQFVVNTLEVLMLLEREDYLEQLKINKLQDKGNGTYARSFKSLSQNSLVINIPRTRYTNFKPYVMEFLKYSQEQVNELVLKLYTKGLSTRDVSEILSNFFGEEMSYSQVSNLAERFHELRLAWENTSLEKYYKVVYCDSIFMTVRRVDSYSKEAVHIIYGVREDNKRELLELSINPTESSNSWRESFIELGQRGIEKIDMIVADGLAGLEGVIEELYPQAIFQKCVVHKMRNVLNKVRPKDKQAVSEEIKEVFNNFDASSTMAKAEGKLEEFVYKWESHYPELRGMLINDTTPYYFSYINLPVEVRRMVYTTNSIESLNKKLRKATKNKLSFEKPDRLLDYLYIVIKEFEVQNWMKYPVSKFSNWTQFTQPA